jgi:hypothetical protein
VDASARQPEIPEDRPSGPPVRDVRSQRDVREITLPRSAQVLSTLQRLDYTDGFRLKTEHAEEFTAEEWARALLEEAPEATRRGLRRGWRALGVRVGPADDPSLVLGWEIRRSSEDFVVLGVRSWIGTEAEVLCLREPDALVVGTLVQLRNPVARTVWACIESHHRKVVRHLVRSAGERVVARGREAHDLA